MSRAFLSQFKVQDKTSPYTHTSLTGGKYFVNLADYNTFLQKYLEVISKGEDLYLTERVQKNIPFRFFLDLDFPWEEHLNSDERKNGYKKIYNTLKDALKTRVVLSTRLTKIHVHCPDLIVTTKTAENFFEISKRALFEQNCDKDKVCDKSVYHSGLRMVGSRKPKSKDKDPSWVTAKYYDILDDEFNPVKLSNNEASLKLLRDTSIFNLDNGTTSSSFSTSPTPDSYLSENSDSILRKWIHKEYHHVPSRVKSIRTKCNEDSSKYILVELDELYCNFIERDHRSNRQYIILSPVTGVSQRCHDIECNEKSHHPIPFNQLEEEIRQIIFGEIKYPESIEEIIKNNFKIGNTDNNITLVGEVSKHTDTAVCVPVQLKQCPICNSAGGCSHLEVQKTGQALLKCQSNPCLFFQDPQWQQLSSAQLNVFFPNAVINITNNINIGADNADLDVSFDKVYQVFEDDELNMFVYRALDGTSTHLTELFHFLASNRFVHGESPKEPWFEFVQPRWKIRKTGVFDFIPTVLIDKLQKVKDYYLENRPDGEITVKQVTKITSIIKSILENKKHIIEQDAIPKFAQVDFVQNLDSNRTVIGFNDGVYDFELRSFREGHPEDNISMSVGYDFPRESNIEIRKQILKFFEDIQPEPSERKYLLTFLATLIHGDNKEESFHIFTGTTRNGKSLLSDLLKTTLGDYHTSFAANMLTKERPPPSQPQPDILYLKSKRVAIGSEPENGQKINSGYMKYITGNDIITARGLYENTITEFKPQFKLILLCNVIPLMDSNDLGVWSRSRVVNFPTTFVDEPKLPHEKKIDRRLKERVKNWGPEFMLMLLDIYHTQYEITGLNPTPAVLQQTQEYQEDSNFILQFMNEVVEDSNKAEHIHFSTLYEEFLEWAKINLIGQRLPTNRELTKELRKLGYELKHVKVNGISSQGLSNKRFKKYAQI